MPKNKNFCLRIFIYVREIKKGNIYEPVSKARLIEAFLDEEGFLISASTVEKDLYFMRHDSVFGVRIPIKYIKWGNGSDSLGYYLPEDYCFTDELKKAWQI